MRKKALAMVLILLVVSASLFASTASIGMVNYYFYDDIFGEEPDYEAWVVGLRAEWFLADWLGVSGDFIYLGEDPFNPGVEYADVFVNGVIRAPLGFIEPYVAAGPGYMFKITEDDAENLGSVSMNVRGGVDFNLLDFLSVGIEANFFVDDLEEFFDNSETFLSEQGLKDYSLIGITAKFKF